MSIHPGKALFRFMLGQRLPKQSGVLRLPGLRSQLEIARDRFGIPYVDAANEADAWFGLGFCQAQDRAFQLELRLRTARGSLAALVGQAGVGIDRLSRLIGFRRSAGAQLPVLSPAIREQIEAFTSGINAGFSLGVARPHELVLLRGRLTPWQATDVLAAAKLVSFLLVGNWDVELARLKILLEDGAEALQALDPAWTGAHDATAVAGARAAAERLEEDLAELISGLGQGGGSNNWAIAGSRTASGRPLLANDPHLDPSLPAHWYLARLKTPQWQVAGATLAGSPAFGAGHNGFCAWGVTASMVDTVDLFVEELGTDGQSVREADGFRACEVVREVIEVRGGAPVVEDVLITPRGPLIGPALTGESGAISMRALWLQPLPARGFLEVHKARSLAGFKALFEQWPLLSQNVAYADSEGNIANQVVGQAPRRLRGSGSMPQPAWLDQGWPELIPLTEMPALVNPETGFVASANNAPSSDAPAPYLGLDWLDGYRYRQIGAALQEHQDWDVAACLRLQMDTWSQAWLEVRDVILALAPGPGKAAQALSLLRSWDGRIAADSPAASVFELFLATMGRRAAEARAPKAWQWARGRGFTDLLPITTFAAGRSSRLLRLLREQADGWFARDWAAEMADALDETLSQLQANHGGEPAGWGWGKVRPLTLQHPLGRVPKLAWLLNRGPFATGGDGNTVAQAGVNPLRPLGNPLAIASLRAVIDVGDWDSSRFVLPGGQSGNPLSRHYDDLLPYWLQGEGIAIAWSKEARDRSIVSTLKLEPLV